MTEQELRDMFDELRSLPHETEWVEFKCNNANPQEIGEYISALSNSARLHSRQKGYLVFGIEDKRHEVTGTTFRPHSAKKGNVPLEAWLAQNLNPRIDFCIHEFAYGDNKSIVLIEINAAIGQPVKFDGTEYIRVGESKRSLKGYPDKERRLWQLLSGYDWSVEICEGVGLEMLDHAALRKAREQYAQRHPQLADDSNTWDTMTFLNKAKLAIQGKLTRTALILLGKDDALNHHFPSRLPIISWILKDEHGIEQTHEHFSAPLILRTDDVFSRIRNITIRHIPEGTLFPNEISQYDPWVIREALHNAIAHQDYDLNGRISVVEKPDELIITNVGDFMPGSVEEVIRQDAPQSIYRNPFLAMAMVNLNMIEIIGSGIKKMFNTQRNRFFPLPEYDLSKSGEVKVVIPGRILDENYARLLVSRPEMDLNTVMLLDKVQKKIRIAPKQARYLRGLKLIEGRYPNLILSSHIASLADQKASYIKQRGFDDNYYIKLVIDYLKEYRSATRKEIEGLLLDKLPEILTNEQRIRKIGRILSVKMAGRIVNTGSRKSPKWVLRDEENI